MISIVLPCQNEERAISFVVGRIRESMKGLDYEILLSDSSADRSRVIAKSLEVRVINHGLDGYGNALMKGIEAARGEYIVMCDCDGSYDYAKIPQFIAYLRRGYEFDVDRFVFEILN